MQICKILFSILVIIYLGKSETHTEWFQYLIKYIQVDSRKYQVFLIVDNDVQDLRTNLLQEITKSFPIQRINFQCMSENGLKCLKDYQLLINDPRGRNLITIVPTANASETIIQTSKAVDSLVKLSKGRTRPKCLLILPIEHQKFSYKKLLHKLWIQQVLDATILEVEQNIDNHFTEEMNQNFSRIIQYNPFPKGKNFHKQKISAKIEWFPNKLNNLHQWKLNLSLISQFPMANVTRNKTGHVIKMSGMEANIIRFFAKELNFSVNMVPHNYISFGYIRRYGNQTDGFARMLENNTINFSGNHIFGQDSAFRTWTEISREIDWTSIQAIVPIQKIKMSNLIAIGNMSATIVICIVLIIFLLLLRRILKLDKNVWQPLILFQMLFGYGVKKEPKKFYDRIIFTTMLFTSMILSMNIYDVCTDIGINFEMEKKITNFDDLVKLGLKVKISESLKYNMLYNLVNGSALYTVLINSEAIKLNKDLDCLEELANYRNVCCLVKTPTPEYASEKFRDKSGEPIMTIMPEFARSGWYYIYFEYGSPYVTQFDRLFQRIFQSGIRSTLKEKPKRWYAENTDQLENEEIKKISELVKLYFYIFLVVNCLIIVVFLLERFLSRNYFFLNR